MSTDPRPSPEVDPAPRFGSYCLHLVPSEHNKIDGRCTGCNTRVGLYRTTMPVPNWEPYARSSIVLETMDDAGFMSVIRSMTADNWCLDCWAIELERLHTSYPDFELLDVTP